MHTVRSAFNVTPAAMASTIPAERVVSGLLIVVDHSLQGIFTENHAFMYTLYRYPVMPESVAAYFVSDMNGLRCWSDSDCNVCGQAAQSCCPVDIPYSAKHLKLCQESCSGDAGIGSPRVLNTEYIYSGQQLVIIVLAALSLLTIFGVICNCLRSRCGVMRHEQKYQAVSMDRTVAEESESEQVGFKDEAI